MKATDFCYWLQGFFEIADAGIPRDPQTGLPTAPVPNGGGLSLNQLAVVRRHLDLVFAHDIDPKAGGPDVQKALNEIHNNPLIPFADKGTLLRC